MKKRLSITQLHVGMFIEAEVLSILVDGEVRHFLKPTAAAFVSSTAKRLRLSARKNEQIAHAGGMLMTSEKQIKALQEIGVSEVVINTDKSDVIPDLPELAVGKDSKSDSSEPAAAEKTPENAFGPEATKTAEGGYKWLTSEGEAEWSWGKTPGRGLGP